MNTLERHGPVAMKANISDDKKAAEFLANERTFLAWIRTSIAVMSLGFVVAKFDVWIRELATRLDPQSKLHGWGVSLPIGVAMMAFGGVLAILAAWHYHIVNLAIERGEVRADRTLIVIITFAVAVLAVLMIGYLLLTVRSF